MGAFKPSNTVSTTITTDDLEVDSGTLSIDATNNRVGIGDTVPGTQVQVKGTAPYLTIQNSTAENSDGGCEGKIIFEDHANASLAVIQGSHDGTANDTKGDLILSTHNGSSLAEAMRLDSAQLATFAGRIITDDATEATTTTDGSLQTDGGLSVALSAVIGDDLDLISDGAIINFGVNKEIVLTHVHDTGLTLESSAASTPVFEIKNTNNGATAGILKFNNTEAGNDGADADDLGSITFWGNDDGTPSAQQYAGILAEISDASSGTEGGKLSLQVAEHDGTVTTGLLLQDGDADGEIDVTIGAGAASIVTVPGVLFLDGSSSEALRINKADGDTREIVLENDGADKVSMYMNSAEHFFIRQEVAANDIILRMNTTNVLQLDGSEAQVNIAWPVEVANASDGGTAALLIDNDDTNQIALNIEAANIDAAAVNITADALTTSTGIALSVDGLTSGKGVDVTCSNNSLNGGVMINAAYSGTSTNNQAVLKLTNDHASATGTSLINLDQDSTGPLIYAAYGANGSAMQLKVAEQEVTLATGATTTDVSSFFPAGSVPIAIGGRVTVALTNNAFITKVGTTADDDMFTANAFTDGQIEAADATFVLFSNNAGTTVFPTAGDLRITHNAAASGGGKVRLALYHWLISAPTG
mgnify:CR=1 FL=1